MAPRGQRVHADYWPFYTSQYLAGRDQSRVDSLGPIFTYAEDGSGRTEFTVRPFYSYMNDPVAEEREHLALYPLVRYREQSRSYGPPNDRTRKQQFWALPLVYYSYFSSAPGDWEYDYIATPLVFGGDSAKDGSHFAVLPFGGNLKGLFGMDEVTFIMGPAYVELRRGEQRTWYFPFPILKYGTGPGYEAFAFLPFYNREVREGKHEHTNIMWPFIGWGREALDTAHPREYWHVLPFAGRSWSDDTELLSIMWPFFNFASSKRGDSSVIDAPWPFFRLAKGEYYEEFRLWPFYAQSRVQDDWTYNIAWPFVWYFDEKDPDYDEQRLWVLPFYSSRSRQYKPDNNGIVRTEGSVSVWPFARYDHEVDGTWRFQFPYVLPYIDQRFERVYRDIFRLVAIEGGPDRTAVSVLWGAASYYDDKWESSLAIHPLFRYHLTKYVEPGRERLGAHERDVERFDILYGLIGRESGPDGNYTRFLWVFEVPY